MNLGTFNLNPRSNFWNKFAKNDVDENSVEPRPGYFAGGSSIFVGLSFAVTNLRGFCNEQLHKQMSLRFVRKVPGEGRSALLAGTCWKMWK